MKTIEIPFNKEEQRVIYRTLVESIVPRPIAFVSTVNKDGVGNLAPFSFFNGVAGKPPTLMISISRKDDGSKKDTLLNIEETGEFVVNSVNEWILEASHQCSADYPFGVDEMKKVGLTPIASKWVKPPRVQEAGIQMECRMIEKVEIGDGTSPGNVTTVFGEILTVHVHSNLMTNGHIDPLKLKPIARLGGPFYAKVGDLIEIARANMEKI